LRANIYLILILSVNRIHGILDKKVRSLQTITDPRQEHGAHVVFTREKQEKNIKIKNIAAFIFTAIVNDTDI
jgi:hypothetical protein